MFLFTMLFPFLVYVLEQNGVIRKYQVSMNTMTFDVGYFFLLIILFSYIIHFRHENVYEMKISAYLPTL